MVKNKKNIPKWGTAFLGRDEARWGKNGTGDVPINPDVCYYNTTTSNNNNNQQQQNNNNNNNNQQNNTNKYCPYYNDIQYNETNDIIHIVIASFRDRLCSRTLYNIITRSHNPYRIYIRVLQQIQPNSNLLDDTDCWTMLCQLFNNKTNTSITEVQEEKIPFYVEYRLLQNGQQFVCQDFRNNIDIVTIDSSLAKGPCDARSKLSSLIEYDYIHANTTKTTTTTPASNDNKSTDNNINNAKTKTYRLHPVSVTDYCMQIDSHMDFSTNFDAELIQMFHRTKNDYAVLSTYVADMKENNLNPEDVPHLCMIQYTESWRNWGTKLLSNAQQPKLTNVVWGAGMSFHKCHGELNVPYDPYLNNVFDGEETSRGIRFFTHGYDIYTPDKVLVTHDYSGHQSNPIIHTWGDSGKKQKSILNSLFDSKISNTRQELFTKVDWSFMERIHSYESLVQPNGVDRINIMMDTYNYNTMKSNLLSNNTKQYIKNGRYGLGSVRTLQQAYTFAGFDPKSKTMIQNHCGNLQWVPYINNSTSKENNFGVLTNIQRNVWNESIPYYITNDQSVIAVAIDSTNNQNNMNNMNNNMNNNKLPDTTTSILANRALLRSVIVGEGSHGIDSSINSFTNVDRYMDDLNIYLTYHSIGGWIFLLLLFVVVLTFYRKNRCCSVININSTIVAVSKRNKNNKKSVL